MRPCDDIVIILDGIERFKDESGNKCIVFWIILDGIESKYSRVMSFHEFQPQIILDGIERLGSSETFCIAGLLIILDGIERYKGTNVHLLYTLDNP